MSVSRRSDGPEKQRSLLDLIVSFRIARTIGILFFLIAFLQYRSPSNRSVLGLWSVSWFGLIGITAFVVVISALAPLIRKRGEAERTAFAIRALFDIAVFCHGLAFLLLVLDQPSAAGGIVQMSIWGGVTPAAAAIGWLALLVTVLAAIAWIGKRLRSSLRKPALVLASIGLLLVIGEGLARIYVLSSPSMGFGALSVRAWMHRFVHVNQLGFRDQDHSLQPQPGTRRLLVVGDSFAYGWGIHNPQHRFGEKLAAALTSRTGDRWETINASRPGTHTLHHKEYLQQGLQYKPDVVALLYVFNDIEYLEDNEEVPALEAQPVVRMLLSNSYLFNILYERVRLAWYRLNGFQGVAFGYADVSRTRYQQRDLLDKHLTDLKRFVDTARAQGAVVTIVPFDPDVKIPGVYELRYKRFIAEAKRFDLPVIDAAAAFEPYTYQQLILSNLDRHPNVRANAVVAEAVATHLTSFGTIARIVGSL